MDRRAFLLSLAALAAAPPEPRRVYSFLWDDEPLVRPFMYADVLNCKDLNLKFGDRLVSRILRVEREVYDEAARRGWKVMT